MNKVDKHIGSKIGGVTIISRVTNYSMSNRNYTCLCECGNETIKTVSTLYNAIRDNNYTTCGCKKSGINIIDKYLGKKISKLTIISRIDDYSTKNQKYNCICDCGNTIIKDYAVLLNGVKNNRKVPSTVSCGGCIINGTHNKGKRRPEKALSHIGEKFNRLTIIDIKEKKGGSYYHITKCDCGNITKNVYADLVSEKVKSCGCYGKEQQSKTGQTIGLNNCTKANNIHKWHYIKNGVLIRMRSGYEVMYAMVLDKENIEWEYEPKRFKLKKGITYLPDFYLKKQNLWIDVKGRITERNKLKYKLFKELGYNFKLVFIEEIQERLGIKYVKFLKQWKNKAKSNNVETPRKANASTE